jgi:ribosomal protein S9
VEKRLGTIAPVILSAFLVAVVLTLAASAFLVVRGLGLYRQVKATSGAVSAPLAAFEEKVGEIDRHLDAFETSSRELERAKAQLARSRARLQVLLDEVERSRRRVRWLSAFLPIL